MTTSPERHISIAPAPSHRPSHTMATVVSMPYNCQPCVRRKVKCDRTTPICSSCVKSRHDCFYQAPPKPRRKKRKAPDSADDKPKDNDDNDDDNDLRARLARYEHILRQNGLLPFADALYSGPATAPASCKLTPQTSPTQASSPTDPLKAGKLVSVGGKTRYIHSRIWLASGDDSMQECDQADNNEPDDPAHPPPGQSHAASLMPSYDPVSGALLGCNANLVEFHPSAPDALKLWTTYTEYVEPLVRIVHVATTAKMVEAVSHQPQTATKAQECLLFAIYNFAVVALDDDQCQREYERPREFLLDRFSYGLKQALVNAQWLATTEIMVFQALLLYLIAMRGHMHTYDPQTFWILTGIAVRIAQRMGLHRDGESLGLPPFEVHMRRCLFWQLLPLEGFASQHSGTGISLSPSSWDTKKPLNINDSDIFPSMEKMPEESKGPTEMMYIMARNELTDLYVRKAFIRDDLGIVSQTSLNERILKMIDMVEDHLEQKVLRYCDVIVPLHFQTLLLVRAAVNATRLRHQNQGIRDNTIDDAGRARLCQIAEKILDSNAAMHANPKVKNFLWQATPFFFWDSAICILRSLTKKGFFTGTWLDATWDRLALFYANHPEVLFVKSPLQISAVKATLEAWAANPPSNHDPEPDYITKLRAHRDDRAKRKSDRVNSMENEGTKSKVPDQSHGYHQALGVPALQDGAFEKWDGLSAVNSFDTPMSPGIGDWGFWDQFFQHAEPNHG